MATQKRVLTGLTLEDLGTPLSTPEKKDSEEDTNQIDLFTLSDAKTP